VKSSFDTVADLMDHNGIVPGRGELRRWWLSRVDRETFLETT
jgi:hypothetical protein